MQEYTDTHVFTTVYEQDSFEPVARLVWLKDELIQAANDDDIDDKPINGIQVFHYHNDHLGTPNELTNDDGEVVWLADYEAWGNVNKVVWYEERIEPLKIEKDYLQPIRFQGQYYDVETGLHYNRFRYFDPDLGMFVSRDPIGLLGGNHVFQYAPNPTGWIDLWGLNTQPSLPNKTLLELGKTKIVHHYSNLTEHADLIHFHIEDKGKSIGKIKADGTLLDGKINKDVKKLLESKSNINNLRRAKKRIANYIRKVYKGIVGGRPFKLGNRGEKSKCL